mmetsp:Transcript_13066/g.15596  ORF Transcript_13066/g.15596 Transcript_13066/m.15596 type:complete len:685 (-) Transcript_13066:145-2199(-)
MEETLGLTIKRSTRSKVAPFQQQFLGYSGQTDSSGQPDGKGTLTYTDDSLLWMSGAFRADSDGIQNGVYKGVFKHGKRHGSGSFSFADGRSFNGEWVEDMFVEGTMNYVNGDVFRGFWVNGLKDNRGVYEHVNGKKYDGYWKMNEKHGPGVLSVKDDRGKGWQCWENDRVIKMEGDISGGDINSSGDLHGLGTVLHQNGEVYDGHFNNGQRHGHGTLYHPEKLGNVEIAYKGGWFDGCMHGKGLLRVYNDDKTQIEIEYEGNFVKGTKHGLAIERNLITGVWREGDWVENSLTGSGKVFYSESECDGNLSLGGPGRVRYEGSWIKDVFHGLGVLWDLDGSVYRGQFKSGSKECDHGDELYSDGSRYEGGFKSNKREGRGKMVFHYSGMGTGEDSSYEGDWVAGRFHGTGVRHFVDGSVYEGEYVCGLQEGKGSFSFNASNGPLLRYIGEWVKGKACGVGQEVYKDGSTYSGSFLNGLRHGSGKMKWITSETYDGEWCEGVQEGQGEFLYLDGSAVVEELGEETTILGRDVYTGSWVKGRKEGHGKLVFRNGDVYVGNWSSDVRAGEGTLTHRDGRVYSGSFVNNKKQGTGTQTWPEGSKYHGEWADGFMNGQGLFHYADGRTYEGPFVQGRAQGMGVGKCEDGRFYHRGLWEAGEAVKVNSKGNREKSAYFVSLPPIPKKETKH